MMEIIGFKDAHVSDKGPRTRSDDYAKAVLKKIHFVGKLAENRKAAAILEAGDLLHAKEPSKVSHSLVKSMMVLFRSFSCPVLSVYGNHEQPLMNMRDARDRHPKSVLYAAGVITHPTEQGYVLKEDGLQVRVVGFDYDHSEHEQDVPWYERVHREPEDDWVICVAHTYAGPKGGKMPDGTPKWDYRKMLNSKADLFFFGHEHTDQGIELIGGKYFVNNGALSRGSLTDDNVTREVNVVRIVLTPDSITPSLVKVPNAQNSSDIFDFSVKKQTKQSEEIVDFISKLSQSKPIDLEDLIEKSPFSNKSKKIVRELLKH